MRSTGGRLESWPRKQLHTAPAELFLREGRTGVIELKAAEGDCPDPVADDPWAVKLMIDHFYLDDYDPKTVPANPALPAPAPECHDPRVDPEYIHVLAAWGPRHKCYEWALRKPDSLRPPRKEGETQTSFLEMHAKLFAMASKYDVKSLENTAREKFIDTLHRGWWSVDLIAAMEIVFKHTPEDEHELRNEFMTAIVESTSTLAANEGFQEVVASIDGLACDLFTWADIVKSSARRRAN